MKRYLHTPEEIMQALKEGKIVKDEYGHAFALKNGFIIQMYAGEMQSVNTTVYLDGYKYYIECPKPLKLEVGKFYKTRRGDKAIILDINEQDTTGFPVRVAAIGGTEYPYFVMDTGRYSKSRLTKCDLVAPWEEAE